MKTAFQGILIGAAGYLALYGAIHYALALRSPVPPPTPPSIAVTRPGTARLHLDGGPYDAVDWRVLYAADITAPVKTTVSKDGLDAEAGDRPGKYLAIASVVRGGAISHADAVFEVPGTNPPPVPDPTPTPAPPSPPGPPQPSPIGDGFYAIAVVDFNKRLPPLVMTPDIVKQVAALGGKWHLVDSNSLPTAADPQWVKVAKTHGAGSLVLVTKLGVVWKGEAQDLPADMASLTSMIKDAMGRH